jgi:hypothetical protein
MNKKVKDSEVKLEMMSLSNLDELLSRSLKLLSLIVIVSTLLL